MSKFCEGDLVELSKPWADLERYLLNNGKGVDGPWRVVEVSTNGNIRCKEWGMMALYKGNFRKVDEVLPPISYWL